MAKRPVKLIATNTYRALANTVAKELAGLDSFVRRRTAEVYWRVGKHIHEHLLKHKDRAKYGATLFKRLEQEVDRDATTLTRMVQFYRAYPIHAERHELTWEHYRSLITVKDTETRKQLETKIVEQDWNSAQLREYLSSKRETAKDTGQPVPRLKVTRGRLSTYQIVAANRALAQSGPVVLDLGFRLSRRVPGNARWKQGDILEADLSGKDPAGARKVKADKDELFTYRAYVEKIIDGDTLVVTLDLNCEVSLSQKLRLRGIDCPEMDTAAGQKAKRFVAARLKRCPFIIVKTYKDRSDKFDRYLADIFYDAGNSDPAAVAAGGMFLNQELLDERLARVWEVEGPTRKSE